MFQRMCNSLANSFVRSGNYDSEQLPWIIYRLECVMSQLITYPILLGIIITINMLYLNALIESLILFVAIALLRKLIGGYHATTMERCFLLSAAVTVLGIGLVGPVLTMVPLLCFALLIVCGVAIFLYAPFIHHHIECSDDMLKRVSLLSKLCYLAIAIALVTMYVLGAPFSFIAYTTSGMTIAVISMLVGKYNSMRMRRRTVNGKEACHDED